MTTLKRPKTEIFRNTASIMDKSRHMASAMVTIKVSHS